MTTLEKFMKFLAEKNYYISEEMVQYYWELKAEDEKNTDNSEYLQLPDQNIISESVINCTF